MLWLDETVYPAAAPPTIGELEWIQYQLDVHATVAEVVASVEEFSIRPIGGKIHYLLADASGERALVEFIDGRARVHRGSEGPLVCTNDTQTLSELAFAKLRTMKLDGTSSRVRYARLRLGLAAQTAPPTVDGAFAALQAVAERGGRYRTQWSAVYEVRKGRIHVRTDGARQAFTIDLAALDWSPGSGTTFQDLFGKQPGNGRFAPLTGVAQRALLGRNLPKVGVDSQLDAIADHLLGAPAGAVVLPLADRFSTLRVRVRAGASGGFARIAVFRSPRELARQDAQHVGSVLLDVDGAGVRVLQPPPGTVRRGGVPRSQPERPSRRRGTARLLPAEPRRGQERLRRPGFRAGGGGAVGSDHARVSRGAQRAFTDRRRPRPRSRDPAVRPAARPGRRSSTPRRS